MNTNFTFAFVRKPLIYASPAPTVARAPVSRAPVPVTRSNRFSINRLINVKTSGGCRSCN